ncbi:MAG: hypothetical protein JXA42_23230, partial [Anaerolineales bacterium]|nr:hypothetical protein [Anaerolineales bacterium]
SSQLYQNQFAVIHGTKGIIKLEKPFNPHPQEPAQLSLASNDETEEFSLDISNQYTLQVDRFSQAILENTDVPTGLEDAIANMRVIDAIFKSAKAGTWVVPG